MPRPKIKKLISQNPKITFYKPRGIPLSKLKAIEITHEEWEALRLKHVENLDQTASAQKMKSSQSTIQRILASAQKKLGRAVVQGKAIKIIKD